MQLIEIQEKDKHAYNNFVATGTGGSFLQAWEWGDWQKNLGKGVRRFFMLNDQGEVVVSAQVIISPLWLGRCYLYLPYGPVTRSSYYFSIADFEFFLVELKKAFPQAIFVRIEPGCILEAAANFGKKSANVQPAKSLVLDLRNTQQALLNQMHHKTRYNIRLAQKHGVEIKKEFAITVGHGLYFKEALNLILETAKRQGYVTHSRYYYQGLLDFFSLHEGLTDLKVHLYKAIYKEQLLSAAVMVDFGKTRNFLFGGSSVLYRNVMAPYLLHFEAIMDAKEMGLEFYDFWGVETSSGQTPGFVRFKLGFGGQVAEYLGAKDFVRSRLWYNIYTLLRGINKFVRKIFK